MKICTVSRIIFFILQIICLLQDMKEIFMVQTARLFLAGSSIYPAIELLYRKKTHVSMAVAGGTSLCFINKVCNGFLKQKSLPVK